MPTSGPGRSEAAGFTLVELLVVIVILAIATAVALTTLNARRDPLGDATNSLASALQGHALEGRLAGLPMAWRCDGDAVELLRWRPQVLGDVQPRGDWEAVRRIDLANRSGVRVEQVEIDGRTIDCHEIAIVLMPQAALPESRIVLGSGEGKEATATRAVLGDSAGRFLAQAVTQ